MSGLFIISDIKSTINFVYFMKSNCKSELNLFSGDVDEQHKEFEISFAKSNLEAIEYRDLPNQKINARKFAIMKNCAEYRLARVGKEKWMLETGFGKNWKKVSQVGDDLIKKLEIIKNNLVEPSLIKSDGENYVLISSVTGGNIKKTRKHKGIIQTGGNAGRLRKGYKYCGKRLKNGLPQIVKSKN